MPDIPGLNSDVFFGDAEKSLPDWRKEMSEDVDNDEDVEPSEEDRHVLIGILGFDPRELDRMP